MSNERRSHQDIFRAVFQHAEAIIHLTQAVPTECQPVDTVPSVDNARWFLTVAYRWGYTNDHHYFVYIGPDQVKAMTMAESEAHDRGGKYGCAVYAFDANGVDYQLMYYAPSMIESEAKAPTHNHKLDYFRALGGVMEDACDGFCWVPNPDKPGLLEKVSVAVPECFHAERARHREVMRAMQDAERHSIDKTKTQSS